MFDANDFKGGDKSLNVRALVSNGVDSSPSQSFHFRAEKMVRYWPIGSMLRGFKDAAERSDDENGN